MANSLLTKEQAWQENFDLFDNWQDRYQFIMEQGRKHVGIPEHSRLESMLVKGCQSQVWMQICLVNEHLNLKADSDALIVKGLIAIINDIYHQQPLSEIINYDHGFAERLGLKDHLSQTRANGLFAMQSQILKVILNT